MVALSWFASFIATALGLCEPFWKRMQTILVFNFIGNFLVGFSYFLTGGLSGAAICLVACVQVFINYVFDVKGKKIPIWLIVIYLIAFLSVNLLSFKAWYDVLSLIAATLFVISVAQSNSKHYRLLYFLNSLVWIFYDFSAGSFGNLVTHFVLLVATLTAIIIKDKKGDYMKIGMRPTSYVKAYGFEKGISKMAEHGFECIDYQDFIRTDTEFFALDRTTFEKELLRQKATFEREGLFVHQAHAPFRFPLQDATIEDRAERFDAMCKSLYGTAVLGGKFFVMHPLCPFSIEAPDTDNPEETFKINAHFVSRLAEYAKEFDITVCVENLPFPYYSLTTCEKVNDFVRALNLDNVKICFDIGHSNYMNYVKNELGIGPADFVPQTIADEVRRFGDKLGTCHIHQNYGDKDAHSTLDEGDIDIKAFSDALFEIGYSGVYSLEVSLYLENYPESEWDNRGKNLCKMALEYTKRVLR